MKKKSIFVHARNPADFTAGFLFNDMRDESFIALTCLDARKIKELYSLKRRTNMTET